MKLNSKVEFSSTASATKSQSYKNERIVIKKANASRQKIAVYVIYSLLVSLSLSVFLSPCEFSTQFNFIHVILYSILFSNIYLTWCNCQQLYSNVRVRVCVRHLHVKIILNNMKQLLDLPSNFLRLTLFTNVHTDILNTHTTTQCHFIQQPNVENLSNVRRLLYCAYTHLVHSSLVWTRANP